MNPIRIRPAAQRDLRAIEKTQALAILHGIARYIGTGHGDIESLEGSDNEFRLSRSVPPPPTGRN